MPATVEIFRQPVAVHGLGVTGYDQYRHVDSLCCLRGAISP